ncbi:MAG: hypothetical protein KKF46_05430 [Nanoarchaeota archaeon]|nr:hypothetical protein [Nanoarchaeota archaeon]MBU1321774.1 hypothetical protein [Nanoarchaeota archaeon]MBU1598473.1 hypothetical protein [Nanoarchaeota archaeon]MBU2440807.1 hypothetical protein [Nanoarchaeota archaeon]
MNIEILLLIIVAVVIIYFATKFLTKTVKIITKVILLIVVVLVFLTILSYKDMMDVRTGFEKNNNTFFLYENNKLSTAVMLKPITSDNLTMESVNYFTKDELEEFEKNIEAKDYKSLLNNNNKIFIVKSNLLDKPYNINLGANLDQEDLLSMIWSEDPFLILAQKSQENYDMNIDRLKENFKEIYGTEETFKGYIFAGLIINIFFNKQETGDLTKNLKTGDLKIYPESISFKISKYLPWA